MATIGVRIELEGAPKFSENMKNLTAQTKLYQAQVKKLTTEMNTGVSAFTKSITTSKALQQQLQAQQNQSKALADQIKKVTAEQGEDATQVIRLKTQYENLQRAIAQTNQALEAEGGLAGAIGKEFEAVGSKIQTVSDKMSSLGSSLIQKVTAPIAAVGTLSVKAFSDWESAFAGVMKTVDETATTTYADIAEGIKQMATETASSKTDIASVAEAAGQLGIGADDILKFTKTMIMLGDSTNLSSEEAATSLARIMNITGESTANVDKLGSSIVALGNSFATNESSIVEMSNRLASAGTIAGLSTTDIFALATAMSSVGIEAEAGGTAMTQTLTSISQAVSESGAKLDTLAQVAGLTADEFASKWKSAPTEALQSFIDGLSQMNSSGEDTYKILDELGMSGVRQSNMLQSLALANDQLASAMDVSNKAYQENSALQTEAEKRYETSAAKMNQFKEELTIVGVEIGEIVMPYILKFGEKVKELAQWFSNLSPEMQKVVVAAAAIAAAIGPLFSTSASVGAGVATISKVIGKVVAFGPAIGGALSSVGAVITGTIIPAIGAVVSAIIPFLPVIAGVAPAIAAVVLVVKNWGTITDWISEKWAAFTEYISEAVTAISEFFSTHFGAFSEMVAARIEIITTLISAAIEVIKTIFIALGETLKALFTGDWKAIGEIIKAAWLKIAVIILEAKAKILQTIAKLITSIGEKFKGLASQALTWGSDMIQGFIDGIKAKWEALKNTVGQVAESIKSYLGFSEPEKGPMKDFNSWPRHMMQNYASGIESMRFLVKNAVADVSADVAVLENPFNASDMYDAVRRGASDANMSLSIGGRDFSRTLKDMGVVFGG